MRSLYYALIYHTLVMVTLYGEIRTQQFKLEPIRRLYERKL